MTSRYWSCSCGVRNPRVKQKCTGEDCGRSRPKRRVPAHARTLRDDPYPVYEAVNASLHAPGHGGEWTPDCCGVCGKPPTTARHMDRDHDHLTGLPRGLACPGNQGCNALMPKQLDLARARLVVAYLERVEARDRSVAVVTGRVDSEAAAKLLEAAEAASAGRTFTDAHPLVFDVSRVYDGYVALRADFAAALVVDWERRGQALAVTADALADAVWLIRDDPEWVPPLPNPRTLVLDHAIEAEQSARAVLGEPPQKETT